jgi:hypothetical protein
MPTGANVLAILAVKIACCGLLLLGASGALAGLGAWLLDGPDRRWLALAPAVAMSALLLARREQGRRRAAVAATAPPGGRRAGSSRPSAGPDPAADRAFPNGRLPVARG